MKPNAAAGSGQDSGGEVIDKTLGSKSKLGTLSVLGCGNMGAALVRGLLAKGVLKGSDLVLTDVDVAKLQTLAKETGAHTAKTSLEAAGRGDVVLIAVKPKDMEGLLKEISPAFDGGADRLLLTIAAGVPLPRYEMSLPKGSRVIRVMPNMPAMVGCGAAALARGARATQADMDKAKIIFEAVGLALEAAESEMDAVTALSGSGPGFLMLVVEALAEAGVAQGLSPEIALKLAAKTMEGSGKVALESSDSPAEIRKKVTSPGGTTEAGLKALEGGELKKLFGEAVRRATERGRELGKA